MEITDISIIKVQKETLLPDGIYFGTWGGYIITLDYDRKTYALTTKDGAKGMTIKVIVSVKGGVSTFETIKN